MPNSFNIIRFRGDRKQALIRMINGAQAEVERQPRIYVDHFGDVKCAEYQEHFVFQNPDRDWET